MSNFAPVDFKSMSPHQQTEVRDWKSADFIQNGYRPVSRDPGQQALGIKLHQIIEKVKSFFGGPYELVDINAQDKMPPFFVQLDEDQAFFHPKTRFHSECFVFNDKSVNREEIVCHEYTHGVIENINPLGSEGQAGALNESIADVVGIVFKHWMYGPHDLKIATLRDLSEHLDASNLKFSEPEYDDDGKTTNDNGNVHHNSRLFSHAFFLASTELKKHNVDPENELLLKIWWDSILSLRDDEKTFNGFVKRTIENGALKGLLIKNAIIQAWKQVGMLR
jgi:hypothetical protein